MPLYVPRTTAPQGPGKPSMAGSSIAPVPTLGGPAAAAVAGVGQQLAGRAADIYQQERDREIETRVRELDVQRRTADAEVLNGYRQALGKAAVDGRGEAMAAISSNSARVREGIADREVARAWGQQDARLTLAAQDELDGHYRQQNIKWQADTHEARADLLVSDLGRVAFGEGFDPATGRLSAEAERTRSAYRDELTRLGGLMGWDASVTETHLREADSAAFGQVAETLVRQGRWSEAQAVLEQHRERIEEGPRQQLMGMAREGVERQAAVAEKRRVADVGLRLSLELGGAGILTDQVDEIDARWKDGKITTEERHEAVKLLTDADSREFTASTRERNAALQAAQEWSQQNPQGPRDPNLVGPPASADLRPLPPELAVRLERSGARRAYDIWRAEGGQWTMKPEGRQAMLSWGDAQLRSFPTKESLVGYLEQRMDPENLGRMVKRWDEAHKPPEQATMGEGEKMRLAKKLALDFGIVPTIEDRNLSDDDSARLLRWFVSLDREVATKVKDGRKPGYQDYEAAAKGLSSEVFEVDGAKRILAVATPAEIANGRWSGVADGKPWSIDANAVQALRADALEALKGRYTEGQVTESMIARQAYWMTEQRTAQTTQATDRRQQAERMLTEQFRTALYDPQVGSDRQAAVAKVLATWGDRVESLGMSRADAEELLQSLGKSNGDAGRNEAWEAEKRRRQDLLGKRWQGYGLMSKGWAEGWDRKMFLGSEEARRLNAAKFPNDPDFFYENWHKLDSSLMTGRIKSRAEAARTNPYLDPNYKGPGTTGRTVEEMVRQAAR